MLGWWIVITTQTLEQRAAAAGNSKESTLATWDASIGGMEWILELCKQGKAEQHAFSGYPNRFTARAGDIFALLDNGITEKVSHGFRDEGLIALPGSIRIHHDRIAACSPEQTLMIEVWDQS